ncbi:MAG: endonuclease/exonuclease/phosphatase family protein [Planctomycetes bacterium]|nr:endonuclease/exonuclease/phosphatase family protein [Planctomycetota bacterium]
MPALHRSRPVARAALALTLALAAACGAAVPAGAQEGQTGRGARQGKRAAPADSPKGKPSRKPAPAPAPAPAAAAVTLNVLSYNILVGGPLQDPGFEPWNVRRQVILKIIRKYDLDLIGLQEPMPAQLTWLKEQLPEYTAVSPSYTDSALMFRAAAFEKVAEGFWWHSPTPEKQSRGFGNFLFRLCVWVRLKHTATGRELVFMNTHYDNTSPSQARSAPLTLQKVAELFPPDLPIVFTGDFNSKPDSEAYKTLTASVFRAAHEAVENSKEPVTSDGSDHDFAQTIDHVFFRGSGLSPAAWQVVKDKEGEKHPSDHFAIFARLRWTDGAAATAPATPAATGEKPRPAPPGKKPAPLPPAAGDEEF